jgi:hypothetical protein
MAAPGQVRRLLAGEAGEVALVDQRYAGALAGQRGRRDRAIDAATNDQRIEGAVAQLGDTVLAECHAGRASSFGSMGK